MPRMQLYLPDDLFSAVKSLGLPASELLQGAVRAELRRREQAAAVDAYVTELAAEVGDPTPEEQAAARAWVAGLLSGEPPEEERKRAS